ncbi:MAG: diguanylate cyclase [Acholeplasmatales bacterium]|nr:MAG: diguanylate cyclase [Acholeplasmatales bacterium]
MMKINRASHVTESEVDGLESIYRITPNVLAFVVLSIFWLFAYNRLDRRDNMSRLFLRMSAIIIPLLLVEALTVLINNQPVDWFVPLSIVLHVLLFAMAPILTYLWYRFVTGMLQSESMHNKKRHYMPEIFAGLVVFVTLMTPFFGWMFTVSAANVYQRGPAFLVSVVIVYGFLFVALVHVLRYRRTMIPQERMPFVVFCMLPIFGGLLQGLFYGLLTMWSSAAFTLLFAYVFLEQRLIRTDYLTGAWRRETFMNYLDDLIEQRRVKALSIAYIDVDRLKRINDNHGHAAGDLMLKAVVQNILATSGPFDVCARFGGDEFVWLVHTEDTGDVKQRLDTVEATLVNQLADTPMAHLASFSWGVGRFEPNRQSFESFLHEIDRKMYATKQAKVHLETMEGASNHE